MKVSQREKNLLIATGGILIAVLYYQFILVPNQNEVVALQQELSTIQTRYNQVMENIATLEERKDQIIKISAGVTEKTSTLYPTLIQEKVILALDELINETDIQATIGFSQVSAQVVEPFTGGEYELPQSSLSEVTEEYRDLTNQEKLEDKKTTSEQSNLTTSTSTAQVMSISLSINGAYENIKNFIDAIQAWDYNMVITNLSLIPLNDTDVSGTLILELYAIPKLDNQDQEYLNWTLDNTYGKDMPFSSGAASGAYSTTMEQLLAAGVKTYDFMMLVRSSTSDLPSVTVGKALDESRESYLFTDKNEIEPVNIIFTQKEDKYYYCFETAQGKYPQGKEAMEFTPIDKKIDIKIMSESRQDATDKVGVEVKISNQTDLIVDVEIKDDDQSNPRVKILSEGSTVNVTNK